MSAPQSTAGISTAVSGLREVVSRYDAFLVGASSGKALKLPIKCTVYGVSQRNNVLIPFILVLYYAASWSVIMIV